MPAAPSATQNPSQGVCLVIPALNEAASLAPLLAEVPPGLVHQLIVVDNGSTDGTGQVARAAGALVVSEPRRGYGYACAAGAAAAQSDLLAFMDGDGSFLPTELPRLLAPLQRGAADLVLGTRRLRQLPPGVMPSHQRSGNLLVAWLLRRLYGLSLTDLGPYRAIRQDLLASLDMQERTYGWPVEMIVKAARRRQRILEVPVTYRPRSAGQSKVGGTLRGSLLSGYRFFRVLLRYAYW
jgi:glycosyltransferase involved in cell wall biosynthesis